MCNCLYWLAQFFVGLVFLYLGQLVESGLLIILGVFFGTLVAGFFILYPIVRLLFGGRYSILTALTTACLEGVITNKIVKNAKKKRRRY